LQGIPSPNYALISTCQWTDLPAHGGGFLQCLCLSGHTSSDDAWRAVSLVEANRKTVSLRPNPGDLLRSNRKTKAIQTYASRVPSSARSTAKTHDTSSSTKLQSRHSCRLDKNQGIAVHDLGSAPAPMDFLKSAVASAIASGPPFPYTFGDKVDIDESIWTLYNGTRRVGLPIPK
jgi:hypothetical protein